MSDVTSIFAYSEALTVEREVYVQKDVNYLRSLSRAGKLSETDAAILYALSLAHYANRANIEAYLRNQKSFSITKRPDYKGNLAKLMDNGMVARLKVSCGERLVPPMYTLTPACVSFLPTFLGKKDDYFCGIPEQPVQEILCAGAAFQAYCSLLESKHIVGEPKMFPTITTKTLNIHAALVALYNNVRTYWFVARRSRSIMGRLRYDLNNLVLHIAGIKEASAVVIICEDIAHMEAVSRSLSTAVPVASNLLLFSFDGELYNADGSLALYSVDTSGASAVLNRVEIAPE